MVEKETMPRLPQVHEVEVATHEPTHTLEGEILLQQPEAQQRQFEACKAVGSPTTRA